MNWVGRELLTAMLLGMCAGVAVAFPAAGPGLWGVLHFAGFVGAVGGAIIGSVAVMGGRYAQYTARWWVPRSSRRWRHRFAVCSAAAVALVWAALLGWAASTGPESAETHLTPWLAWTAVSAVSYLCAYLLAPGQPRVIRSPAADPIAPTTPPASVVATGIATQSDTGSRLSGTGVKSQNPAPENVGGKSDGTNGPGIDPSESET